MVWLDSPGFARRPVVFVEDHLYHTGELLESLTARHPELVSLLTVCAVDHGGPDTDRAVTDWLARYPTLQVAAVTRTANPRVRPVDVADLDSLPRFAAVIASLLRPAGILLQDIQLSPLAFIPAHQWWHSIYIATNVRGLLAGYAPAVRFLSNKRGYEATFGQDLLGAGFDPRDVISKADLSTVAVPAIAALFDERFALALDARLPARDRQATRVTSADRDDLEGALDLLLWPASHGAAELCGRQVSKRVGLRPGSHELTTWTALVADCLDGGAGLPVVSLGERIGPPDAERAELTNVAARHIHTLRGRLRDPSAIVTSQHAYRLSDQIAVARVHRADLRSPPA